MIDIKAGNQIPERATRPFLKIAAAILREIVLLCDEGGIIAAFALLFRKRKKAAVRKAKSDFLYFILFSRKRRGLRPYGGP